MTTSFDVVIPTAGRTSLAHLLESLASSRGPRPARVVVVDDRPDGRTPLVDGAYPHATTGVDVVPGRAAGPASARNAGWQQARAEWVVFLDDDVVVTRDWLSRLADDLARVPADVAASQGRITVPLPSGRRPTDWERNVQGLERAQWATADMAYRRSVLEEVGGFDERFPRAYREDSELALRVLAAGYRIARGRRVAEHPARPAGFWTSVRLQAGNADDVLMSRLHGRSWRDRAGAPRGRLRRHVATCTTALVAIAGMAAGRRGVGEVAALAWCAGTAELAWARIRPGPRSRAEVSKMLVTSVALPFAATYHWARGHARGAIVGAAALPRREAVGG